jgi:hypothetical protein
MVIANPRKKSTRANRRRASQDQIPGIHFATPDEWWEMFDFEARKLFGISGDEFLLRRESGAYKDISDLDTIHKHNRLVMLMPVDRRK